MFSSKRSFLAWAVASSAIVLPPVSAQCNPLIGKSLFLVSQFGEVAADLLVQQHARQFLAFQRTDMLSISPDN